MDPLVICWWGPHLRLLGSPGQLERRELAEGADPIAAILDAVAGEQDRPRAARIIYQSDRLEAHEIDPGLVRLRRGRRRRELAATFPVLGETGAAWSVTAPAAAGEARRATLHFETRSPVPELAAALVRAGLTVEGAWPLAALVELDAAADSVNLAAMSDRGLVAWRGPGSESGVEFHAGDGLTDALIAILHRARAQFDEDARPRGWLAVEDSPSSGAIREAASGIGLTEIALAELLGRARRLAPGSASNFLPPSPWPARRSVRRRIAAVAGFTFLAGLAALGWSWRLHRERGWRQQADAVARRLRLQGETAAGLARRNQARQLAAELTAAASPPQHHAEWLLALAQATPPTIILQRLATRGETFTIAGHILPSADPAGNPLAALRRSLSTPETPWTLQGQDPAAAEDAGAAGSDFIARGRFRTNEPAASGAAPLEELAAKLAEERSRLPSATAFDAGVRPWGRHWIAMRQSGEHQSGWEVRRYDLAYDHPRLDDWPDIVDMVEACCRAPGVTIDRLALASAPESGESFSQAEVSLTVRLRP